MALGSAARAALQSNFVSTSSIELRGYARESDVDVVVSDDLLENEGSVASRVAERLIDDIPCVDFALVVTCDVGDVVLENSTVEVQVSFSVMCVANYSRQSRGGPRTIADPVREFLIPAQIVSCKAINIVLHEE